MSSKTFADKMILFLDRYKNYSEKDKRIVHYGLETIYIFITKLLFITIISLFLGITKDMYVFILFYFLLRYYSSGMHLSTSIGCTLFSTLLFIIIPFLCRCTNINLGMRIIISGITFIIYGIYSPADTNKKPIINIEKRKKLKIKTIILCTVYLILILVLKENYILNAITYALIVQSFFVSPIAYKLFKQPYNNYKKYI